MKNTIVPRLKKSKWYLFRRADATVLLSLGAFPTETQAFHVMFQSAAEQPDHRYDLQERKPEFVGVATIKGDQLLERERRGLLAFS